VCQKCQRFDQCNRLCYQHFVGLKDESRTFSAVKMRYMPIKKPAEFATLTYKMLHSSQPHYLSNSTYFHCDILIKNVYLLLEVEQLQPLVVLNILQFPFGIRNSDSLSNLFSLDVS